MVEINIQENTITTSEPVPSEPVSSEPVPSENNNEDWKEQKEANENKERLERIVENILVSICDFMTLYSDISTIQDNVINARMREITNTNFNYKIGITVMNFLDDIRDYAKDSQYDIQFTTSLDDYIDCFVYEKANQLMHYFYPAIVDGWLNYNYNTDTYTGFDRDEFSDKISEFITITLIKHTFQEYNYTFTEAISSSEETDESEKSEKSESNSEKHSDNENESSPEQLARSIEHSSNTECIIS